MSNMMTTTTPEDEIKIRRRGPVNKPFLRLTYAVSGGAKVKMLEQHQEVALLDAWLNNRCPAAIDQLLRSFEPLLVSMARRICDEQRCPHLLEDIYGAGVVAFIEAIDAFRVEDDNRLSTFVRFRIAGAMLKTCLDYRLPLRTGTSSSERKAFYRHRATIDAFEQNKGRAPRDTPADLAQISADLGISSKAVQRGHGAATAQVVPLDAQDIVDDATGYEDTAAVREILSRTLEQATASLSARDREIFSAYIGTLDTKVSFSSLAQTHDITKERVGQIVRKTLGKVRKALSAQGYGQTADLMLNPS
jgi:RNA polymerase sigma factor (sigma-70 family)